jgi:hypothetical protein
MHLQVRENAIQYPDQKPSLGPTSHFQPVEAAPESRRIGHGQLREPLLGHALFLRKRD